MALCICKGVSGIADAGGTLMYVVAQKGTITRIGIVWKTGHLCGNKYSGGGLKEIDFSADTGVFGASVQQGLCLRFLEKQGYKVRKVFFEHKNTI